jgi:hypothetical protein
VHGIARGNKAVILYSMVINTQYVAGEVGRSSDNPGESD